MVEKPRQWAILPAVISSDTCRAVLFEQRKLTKRPTFQEKKSLLRNVSSFLKLLYVAWNLLMIAWNSFWRYEKVEQDAWWDLFIILSTV